MPSLYPLRILPEFHQRIWGTRDLSPIYAEAPGGDPIGEVWLTGDACKVANGPYAGTSLGDLARQFGRDLVGDTAPLPDRFPLLIKFLFPREKLSVQVHPDDEGARALGQPCGKTECWYVLEAKPGAQVVLGLKPGITTADLERAIRETRAEQVLNWLDVHPDDLIYVDAGTVHAIGGGSVLIEAQQNSDTTFRLYDYGRPRELHVEQGLAAVKERTHAGKVKREARGSGSQLLVESPCFQVRTEKQEFAFQPGPQTAASCLVGLDGCGVVEWPGGDPVTFVRGEAVIVPASLGAFRVRPQWEMEVFWAKVPSGKVSEPETEMFESKLETETRN
jgi:mannose-6-phosphate isomerase